MSTVRLTQIGDSTGVVLPTEILERLRLKKGDLLHLVDTPSGIELTRCDPELERQMVLAEQVMREDRDVLGRCSDDLDLQRSDCSEVKVMLEERPPAEPWHDPIVAEVRAVREALFAESGYDMHEYLRRIIARQETSGHRILKRGELLAESSAEALRKDR